MKKVTTWISIGFLSIVVCMLAFSIWIENGEERLGTKTETTSKLESNDGLPMDKPFLHGIHSFSTDSDEKFLTELSLVYPKVNMADQIPVKELIVKSFTRLHAMGDYFNANQLQLKELEELLEVDDVISVATNILIDFDQTLADFKDDQALVRLYAIKLLEVEADNGNDGPLYDTASILAEQLNDLLGSGQTVTHGRQYDLEKLLRIMVARKDPDEFKDPNVLVNFLYEAGFQSSMHKELVTMYDDAVFFPLLNEFGRSEATTYVSAAIDSMVTKLDY